MRFSPYSILLALCLVQSLCSVCLLAASNELGHSHESEWDEGLEEFFHKVDRDGDGQIEAQEAAQYIGDSDIFQDEDLAQAIEQVCTCALPFISAYVGPKLVIPQLYHKAKLSLIPQYYR